MPRLFVHVVPYAQMHRLLRDQQALEDEPPLRMVLLGVLQRQDCVDLILTVCHRQAIVWLVPESYCVRVVADRLEEEDVLVLVFGLAYEPFDLFGVDGSSDRVRNAE